MMSRRDTSRWSRAQAPLGILTDADARTKSVAEREQELDTLGQSHALRR